MKKTITKILILSFLCFSSIHAQTKNITFSINNFIHQKSNFNHLNEIDTKGGFLKPQNTFGQQYLLTNEKETCKKTKFFYGIGLGYTRIAYFYMRSEEFLSIGREVIFSERSGLNTNAMLVVPLGLSYELSSNQKSTFNLNLNLKPTYSLRTLIKISAGASNEIESKSIYTTRTPVNDENSLDFTVGMGIDYRRQVSNSSFWWKLGLNYNYALTNLYTGTGTFFGDSENLEIEIKNKFHHYGLSLGVIYIKQNKIQN